MFAYGGICAAKVLHSRLLKSILSAPVSFFDVTPVCNTQNRKIENEEHYFIMQSATAWRMIEKDAQRSIPNATTREIWAKRFLNMLSVK